MKRNVQESTLRNIMDNTYQYVYDKNLGNVIEENGRELIMMGSINYLGLSKHPKVIEAVLKDVQENGIVGTGARYSDGYTSHHKGLEDDLKTFFNRKHCLIFNSGFLANLGTISSTGRGAIIFSDKENHPSILDGMLLARANSGAQFYRFRHNDPKHFEELVKRAPDSPNKWLVLVGTFGSKGEHIKLAQFVEIAKKYNIKIFFDDAHSIIIDGENKRGLSEKENVYNDIDILMGSFQMTFANIGAFIVGNDDLIKSMQYHSRPYMYTYNLPSQNVVAIRTIFEIINSDEGKYLIQKLHENVNYIREGVRKIGLTPISKDSQVICFKVENEKLKFLADQLYKDGLWVQKYLPNENGYSSIRLTPMATHTKEHLDKTLAILSKYKAHIS
ncbi:MAG: aminotransferase class I/II-fold pyridoxal phosphate-dependent enzyme [Flavobacteriales bacterium]|jgi:7-keto-8-aminopelargonate synthetase-like enzyme|nr:aminotransferase class I/II-fold pyridoxal phosphate-dependent enzyme [Flavobacteriales bacterium]